MLDIKEINGRSIEEQDTARERAHKILDMLMDIGEKTGKHVSFGACYDESRLLICATVKKTKDIRSETELFYISDMEDGDEYGGLVKKLAAFMKKAPDAAATGEQSGKTVSEVRK